MPLLHRAGLLLSVLEPSLSLLVVVDRLAYMQSIAHAH